MKSLELAENVLIHDNVFSQGYGIVAQKVMRQSSISRDARLFYAYLCSFAGSGDTAFPSTQTILTELGFSKKTFYKYREELEAFGLIVIEVKNTRHGRQTIYKLPPVPVPKEEVLDIITQREQTKINRTANLINNTDSFPQTAGQKPRPQVGTLAMPCPQDGDDPCPQVGTLLNIDKSNNRKSSINLSEADNTNVVVTDESDTQDKPADDDLSEINFSEKEKAAFQELCSMALKKPDFKRKKRAIGLFRGWLDKGYTSEQIIEALGKYIESYRASNNTPRYFKQLDDWLKKEDGCKFYLGKPRVKALTGTEAEKKEQRAIQELAENDPVYRDLRNRRFAFGGDLYIASLSGMSNKTYYQSRYDEALQKEKEYFATHKN